MPTVEVAKIRANGKPLTGEKYRCSNNFEISEGAREATELIWRVYGSTIATFRVMADKGEDKHTLIWNAIRDGSRTSLPSDVFGERLYIAAVNDASGAREVNVVISAVLPESTPESS
ncbi:hypothetical protein ACWCWQ_31250 [Streptomyces sp. NPDC001571]